MGGGGSNTVTEKNTEPWGAAKPYVTQALGMPGKWLQGNYGQPYPYSSVAPFTPAQTASQEMALKRGFYGSPLSQPANQAMGNTLSGRNLYAGSNPYFMPNYQMGARDITENWLNNINPALRTQAQMAGAANTDQEALLQGQSMNALGRSLGDLYKGMAMSQYGMERGLQNQALGMYPTYVGLDYQDLAKMAMVGDTQQQQTQRLMDEQKGIWQQGQNQPYQNLTNYLNPLLAMSGLGGVQSTSTNNGTNPFAQALGLGAQGLGMYGLGSQLGLWGGGAGAAASGLGSLSIPATQAAAIAAASAPTLTGLSAIAANPLYMAPLL